MSYKNIYCPDCAERNLLIQLDGCIDGRVRLYCSRCKQHYVVVEKGIIANENEVMRFEDYEELMK